MPFARCKPKMRGLMVIFGVLHQIDENWTGVVPKHFLDGRFSFLEPVPVPVEVEDEPFVIIEDEDGSTSNI
jgi:hypothetical protein